MKDDKALSKLENAVSETISKGNISREAKKGDFSWSFAE